MMPKWMPKFMFFHPFFLKVKINEMLCFSHIKWRSGHAKRHQKSIRNRCKDDVEKKMEKNMQKYAKMKPKWEPQSNPKSKKCWNKNIPKTMPKLGARKGSQKGTTGMELKRRVGKVGAGRNLSHARSSRGRFTCP